MAEKSNVKQAAQHVTRPIEEMIDELEVDSVFGDPISKGDVTLIPVAQVGMGFGYGYGFGEGIESPASEISEGGGGGGGGGGIARPVGYVRISDSSVTYEPIVDDARLSIARLGIIMWVVFWTLRTLRALSGR